MALIQSGTFTLTQEEDSDDLNRFKVTFHFTEGVLNHGSVENSEKTVGGAVNDFPEIFLRTLARFQKPEDK